MKTEVPAQAYTESECWPRATRRSTPQAKQRKKSASSFAASAARLPKRACQRPKPGEKKALVSTKSRRHQTTTREVSRPTTEAKIGVACKRWATRRLTRRRQRVRSGKLVENTISNPSPLGVRNLLRFETMLFRPSGTMSNNGETGCLHFVLWTSITHASRE